MKVYDRGGLTLLQGDVRKVLRTLPAASVQTCVTSPPYWGLRSYGVLGQHGLEATPQRYVAAMVSVFAEVWRVLRKDGTLWLNLGDSYAHGGCGARDPARWPKQHRNDHMPRHSKKGRIWTNPKYPSGLSREDGRANRSATSGLKPKDMVGIPWRVALALQDAGWYLRSDIIWHKPNPMPGSFKDRPTSAHEFMFLLAKSQQYHYDWEAIRERAVSPTHARYTGDNYHAPGMPKHTGLRKLALAKGKAKQDQFGNPTYVGFNGRWDDAAAAGETSEWRNKRDVWTISTARSEEAHFAVFPEELVEPCILAGSKVDSIVLDPFSGSGTTLAVAYRHGRRAIGIDLNPEYHAIARRRLDAVTAQRRFAL